MRYQILRIEKLWIGLNVALLCFESRTLEGCRARERDSGNNPDKKESEMSAWTSEWSGNVLMAMGLALLPAAKGLADTTLVAATTPVVAAPPVAAPAEPSGQVSFKIFSDFYYDLTEDVDKTAGFNLSRAYFGYSHAFGSGLAAKVVLDVGRLKGLTKVTYDTARKVVVSESDSRYEAFLKTAMLEWKGLVPKTTLEFGVIGLRQFAFQEKFWGYRYLYPSFMDVYKFGSSADLGATAVVHPLEFLKFNLSVLNGEGYTKDQDNFGEFKSALGMELTGIKGASAFLYYDYMPINGKEAQSTVAGMVGYQLKKVFRLGAEYNLQMANKGIADNDLTGLSFYGTWEAIGKVELLARFDLLSSKDDWNQAGTDGQGIIAGVQYAPIKGVKLAANYQAFTPAADGKDIQPKLLLSTELGF